MAFIRTLSRIIKQTGNFICYFFISSRSEEFSQGINRRKKKNDFFVLKFFGDTVQGCP